MSQHSAPAVRAFTLSFRASGVLCYAGVVSWDTTIAEMLALVGKNSAAWNLGQWEDVVLDECVADVAPVYSGMAGVSGIRGRDSSVALKNRAPSELQVARFYSRGLGVCFYVVIQSKRSFVLCLRCVPGNNYCMNADSC